MGIFENLALKSAAIIILLPRAHAQGVMQSVLSVVSSPDPTILSVVVVTLRACARGKVIGCVCC